MSINKAISAEPENNGLRKILFDHTDLIAQTEADGIKDILQAVRTHLKMEVAFLAEFFEGKRIYRFVDSNWEDTPVRPGNSDPLEKSYCHRIANGMLPELMQDARKNPEAAKLALTFAIPIGAYIGVPIQLSDGSVYGTFCCFSRHADTSLNQRDLQLLRTFAELASKMIERGRNLRYMKNIARQLINRVLRGDTMHMVYQPIFELNSKKIIGYESLARFADLPIRAPDLWFKEANEVGLGIELEVSAINIALQALPQLSPDTYISVNASPATIMSAALRAALEKINDLNRLVLEITEHDAVHQYEEIAASLKLYRSKGLKLAVDDAGAGYASFRHILNLRPDFIKLDVSLTRDIDTDPARRALAIAFVHFSRDTQSKLIAEGVETAAELETLVELGICKAQGYFLARPMKLKDIPNQKINTEKSKIMVQ